MLQWFRLQAPRVAAIALVWIAAIGTSTVVPHDDDCHDAACRAFVVEHDASAHRVGAASAADEHHPLHCLVCHWVRSFRPPTESRIVSTPTVDAGVIIPVGFSTLSGRAPVAQPPLPSPPA